MAKGAEKKQAQAISDYQKESQARLTELQGKVEPFGTSLMATGGVSPEYRENVRSRVASGIQGLYGQLQDRLRRQRARQGGYMPGYSAAEGSLARDLASSEAQGITGAEIGLEDLARQGRIQGAGMLTDFANMYGQQQPALFGMGNQLATRPGFFQNMMQFMQGAGGALSGAGGATYTPGGGGSSWQL